MDLLGQIVEAIWVAWVGYQIIALNGYTGRW